MILKIGLQELARLVIEYRETDLERELKSDLKRQQKETDNEKSQEREN